MEANLLSAVAQTIGRRVFGPFRESGSAPGDRASFRLDTAARSYLWNRKVRFMPAGLSLDVAAPYALQPYSVRPSQWFGARGGAGARFKQGGDTLRRVEDTAASGLRFIGWSDELPGGPRHTGWYCDGEGHGMLRGGVWQLPGKGKAARLIYGYAEFEGRGELNPGSAALCVSDVISAPMDGGDDLRQCDELRDCARWSDSLAERAAEERRDYDSAYQAGRQAAELDAAALEARQAALPLVAEMRAERRRTAGAINPAHCVDGLTADDVDSDYAGDGQFPPFRIFRPASQDYLPGEYGTREEAEAEAARLNAAEVRPAIWAALEARLSGLLETISDKRAERESAWRDCGRRDEPAWLAGFEDEAAGGFVRAVRLGYAKATDWKGPPESNPCNEGGAA